METFRSIIAVFIKFYLYLNRPKKQFLVYK